MAINPHCTDLYDLAAAFQMLRLSEPDEIGTGSDANTVAKFFSLHFRQRQQEIPDMQKLVSNVQKIDPANIYIPLLLGELCRIKEEEELEDMDEHFFKLSKMRIDAYPFALRPLVLSRLALLYLRCGDKELFKKTITEAYTLDRNMPFSCALYGELLKEEDPLQALALFQKAYELEPHDPLVASQYSFFCIDPHRSTLYLPGRGIQIGLRIARDTRRFSLQAYASSAEWYDQITCTSQAIGHYNRVIQLARKTSLEPETEDMLLCYLARRSLLLLQSKDLLLTSKKPEKRAQRIRRIQKDLSQASTEKVTNVTTLYQCAESYMQKVDGFSTDYAKALQLFKRITASDTLEKTFTQKVRASMGLIYKEGGFGVEQDEKEALSYLPKRSSAPPPEDRFVQHAREDLLDFMRMPYTEKVAKATDLMEKIALVQRAEPQDPRAFLVLGELELLQNNLGQAFRHFRKLFDIDSRPNAKQLPEYPFILSRIGLCLLYMNKRVQANAFLSIAHRRDSSDAITLCCLSELTNADAFSRPEMLLQRAYDLEPQNPFVLFHYVRKVLSGTARYLQQQTQDVEKLLLQSERDNPGHILINFLLGEYYSPTNIYKALYHYNKVICSPNRMSSVYGLLAFVRRAMLYVKEGAAFYNPEQAGRDLALVTSLSMHTGVLYEASVAIKEGIIPNGRRRILSLYEKILKINPHHPHALLDRAEIIIKNDLPEFHLAACGIWEVLHNQPFHKKKAEGLALQYSVQKKLTNTLSAFLTSNLKFAKSKLEKYKIYAELKKKYVELHPAIKKDAIIAYLAFAKIIMVSHGDMDEARSLIAKAKMIAANDHLVCAFEAIASVLQNEANPDLFYAFMANLKYIKTELKQIKRYEKLKKKYAEVRPFIKRQAVTAYLSLAKIIMLSGDDTPKATKLIEMAQGVDASTPLSPSLETVELPRGIADRSLHPETFAAIIKFIREIPDLSRL